MKSSESSRASAQRQYLAVAGLTCVRDDCDRKMRAGAGGLCASHYRHLLLGIERPIMGKRRAPADERFDAKVQITDGCWYWTAGLNNRTGYGLFRVRTGFQQSAHLYAWIRERGPVPDGLVLDHTCHPIDGSCSGGKSCLHRRCVRVEHLALSTRGDNSRRCVPPSLR